VKTQPARRPDRPAQRIFIHITEPSMLTEIRNAEKNFHRDFLVSPALRVVLSIGNSLDLV
jgi:hypothetical protein